MPPVAGSSASNIFLPQPQAGAGITLSGVALEISTVPYDTYHTAHTCGAIVSFGKEDESAQRRHFSLCVRGYLHTPMVVVVVVAFAVEKKLQAWRAASSTCCLNRRRLLYV